MSQREQREGGRRRDREREGGRDRQPHRRRERKTDRQGGRVSQREQSEGERDSDSDGKKTDTQTGRENSRGRTDGRTGGRQKESESGQHGEGITTEDPSWRERRSRAEIKTLRRKNSKDQKTDRQRRLEQYTENGRKEGRRERGGGGGGPPKAGPARKTCTQVGQDNGSGQGGRGERWLEVI